MKGASNTDRVLAFFGAAAAVASTLAFATDGWSQSELLVATLIWFLAIVVIIYLFREDIQDIWYGVASDDVRRAVISDVDAIYSLAKDHFGDTVTPAPQIKSLIYRHKGMFWVLYNKNHKKTVISVDGYVCFFPLSFVQVQALESLSFEISTLTPGNVPKKRSDVEAVYIGAVVGRGPRSKAKLLMFVEEKSRYAAARSNSRTVYAKAATRHGRRTLIAKEFEPLRPGLDGLDCYFKKKVNPN